MFWSGVGGGVGAESGIGVVSSVMANFEETSSAPEEAFWSGIDDSVRVYRGTIRVVLNLNDVNMYIGCFLEL